MIHELLVGILNVLTFQCSGARDFLRGKCFRALKRTLICELLKLNVRFGRKQSNTQRHVNRYVHTDGPYLSSMSLINSSSCTHCKKYNSSHSLDASHVPTGRDNVDRRVSRHTTGTQQMRRPTHYRHTTGASADTAPTHNRRIGRHGTDTLPTRQPTHIRPIWLCWEKKTGNELTDPRALSCVLRHELFYYDVKFSRHSFFVERKSYAVHCEKKNAYGAHSFLDVIICLRILTNER